MEDKQPIISIIIPVYNAAKYLHYCLRSIQAQTFSDFECILVNDGSTDNSEFICKDFCKKDSRFILISQINQGRSAARNTGLKYANGEYIFFTDNDDYIHPQMLEILHKALKNSNSDFAISLVKHVHKCESTNPISKVNHVILSREQLMQNLWENEKIYAVIWNKLYKKKTIQDIFFNKTEAEDSDFNIRVYLRSQKAILIEQELYFWIQHNASISNMPNTGYYINILNSYIDIYKHIPKDCELFKAFALWKIFKRLLMVRYYTPNTSQYKEYAAKTILNIKKQLWSDFYKNKNISIIKKIFIFIFYYNPTFYKLFIKIYSKHLTQH